MKAPAEVVYEVVTDYESYPEFLPMIKETEILERQDNVVVCKFSIFVVKNFEYVLRLEHDPPHKTRWTYVRGDFKNSEGGWDFEPIDEVSCRVTYSVDMDMGFFVPKIISKQVVSASLPSMLTSIQKRAEAVFRGKK